MSIKYHSYTLDKQNDEMMNISCRIMQHPLQTLAEKMTNTIYRAAKVCSYQSVSTDKITEYHGEIHSFTYSSVYLMHESSHSISKTPYIIRQ